MLFVMLIHHGQATGSIPFANGYGKIRRLRSGITKEKTKKLI